MHLLFQRLIYQYVLRLILFSNRLDHAILIVGYGTENGKGMPAIERYIFNIQIRGVACKISGAANTLT